MPANSTYGFAISGISTVYTTWSAANQDIFSDNTISVFTGQNIGYGGPAPSPPFHPRQFNGRVHYDIESKVAFSAGVTSLAYPKNPLCGSIDNRVWMNLINSGDSILDSVNLNYQVIRPGSPTPLPLRTIKYFGPLLPGQIDSNIVLPTFQGGFFPNDTLYVYSSFPNGIVDSLNSDDTLMITFLNGFNGGRYIIGDTSANAAIKADFPNFTSVANFLDSIGGICDSIIFEVIDSTFKEQFVINKIAGTSPSLPIIFRGLNGENSTARVSFETQVSDSNYTVWLNGAENIYFENITFVNPGGLASKGGSTSLTPHGTVILGEDANGLYFKNCNIIGATDQLDNDDLIAIKIQNSNDFIFEGCQISNGSIGLINDGGNNGVITHTRFRNQYAQAINSSNHFGIELSENTFSSTSSYLPTTNPKYTSAFVEFNKVKGGVYALNNSLYASEEFPIVGFQFSSCKAKANAKNYLINNFIGIGASYSSEEFIGISVIESDFTFISNNNVAIE